MTNSNWKYYPTIVLCLFLWVTVIVVRSNATNQLDAGRGLAIVIGAICWFTIGICVERIRHPKDR